MQRLRDAEDEQKFGHFAGVEGDIVSGVVQQGSDTRTVLVDLGKIEAIMPLAEQVPGETLRARQPDPGLRRLGPQGAPRTAGRGVADPSGTGGEAVQARGARDRRRDGGDQGGRPRGGSSQQDRGGQSQQGRERQGCLHRADGSAGPRGDARAERGEDRHHRLGRRRRDLRRQRPVAGQGAVGDRGRRQPAGRSGDRARTTSSRWPSAARARTPGSPPGSPAGGSTSAPTPHRLRLPPDSG